MVITSRLKANKPWSHTMLCNHKGIWREGIVVGHKRQGQEENQWRRMGGLCTVLLASLAVSGRLLLFNN